MLKATSSGQHRHASEGRPLRILIVDDNHINLSVLSMLLKRRFSSLIDEAPITVDSALKAIQLLRTHIFDLIMMDIQMPYLSGLEATRRIRNAEDGILKANSLAHIIAVTTAVGDEPELVYRKAKMDGMISKPVRFRHLQQYICSLAHEAKESADIISPIMVHGEAIMPPLPPTSHDGRSFYLPEDAVISSATPDICKGSDFESLLERQTRSSLRRHSAIALARSGSLNDATARPHVQRIREETTRSPFSTKQRSDSSSSVEKVDFSKGTTLPRSHTRTSSMTISRRTLSKQIAREVNNAGLDGILDLDSSDPATSSPTSAESSDAASENDISSESSKLPMLRPSLPQRSSSPGWLLSDNGVVDSNVKGGNARDNVADLPARPSLLQRDLSNGDKPSSDSASEYSDLSLQESRRESQTSSTSTISTTASEVTTPNREEGPAPLWTRDSTIHFFVDSQKNFEHSCSKYSDSSESPSYFPRKDKWNSEEDAEKATLPSPLEALHCNMGDQCTSIPSRVTGWRKEGDHSDEVHDVSDIISRLNSMNRK
ncbi:hypothetical protein CBS101457_004477 [Exobasidium rhododendri]|nr:hypothetical protein CBS101457_004477 [Exobasidium rhododendri]